MMTAPRDSSSWSSKKASPSATQSGVPSALARVPVPSVTTVTDPSRSIAMLATNQLPPHLLAGRSCPDRLGLGTSLSERDGAVVLLDDVVLGVALTRSEAGVADDLEEVLAGHRVGCPEPVGVVGDLVL